MLRHQFGFGGDALIAGAVDLDHCTRCTAMAIESYLATIEGQLDIDGNGSNEALLDGVLVLRFLFGFTGDALTAGAVDLVDCTRCDASTIEPYLQGLS